MRPVLASVVVPPLVILATALTHPQVLTVETAPHWKAVHIWLLVWFPLLALGPWLVARAVDRRASWLVVVGSYGLWQYHVFRPEGPVALALLAAGWGRSSCWSTGRLLAGLPDTLAACVSPSSRAIPASTPIAC